MRTLSIFGDIQFLIYGALGLLALVLVGLVIKFSLKHQLKRQFYISGTLLLLCIGLFIISDGLALFFPPIWFILPLSIFGLLYCLLFLSSGGFEMGSRVFRNTINC